MPFKSIAQREQMKKMAKGGLVSDEAKDLADLASSGFPLGADPEALQAGIDRRDAGSLADLASSGAPLAADPAMLEAALRSARGAGPSQDALDLSDLAASGGVPLAADPDMLDAGLTEARGYAEGGRVDDEEKDPADIPEDIQEFVEKMHKQQRESRPDENWRIKSADKPESVATYKQDEDADEEPSVLERLKSFSVPKMAEGGLVDDPIVTMAQQIDPAAATNPASWLQGAAQKAAMPAVDPMTSPAQNIPLPAPPVVPAPALPSVSRGTMGASPAGSAAPAPTDQDFVNKANKLLGLDPNQQAGFLNLLGNNAQKAQLGAGIAGIGDAIASGGTLGKVNPGALHSAEEQIQGRTREGLEGMQTIRGNQEKAQELGDKLQARDPNSPLSKWAQKAYAGLGKKTGIDLSHASASMIADIAGKSVEALSAEGELALKTMGLDLQKQQVAATIANQQAERRAGDIKNKIEHPMLNTLGMLPKATEVPEGRVTVVDPKGNVGHIPAAQLKGALAKGYKQQ